jgi:hypothetical protein
MNVFQRIFLMLSRDAQTACAGSMGLTVEAYLSRLGEVE